MADLINSSFQQIWEETFDLLTEQGCPAWDEMFKTCMYLDTNGNKCAIGQHIPFSLYEPEMEGRGITTVCRIAFNTTPSPDRLDFLSKLQGAHDKYLLISLNEFHTAMRALARGFNLEITR